MKKILVLLCLLISSYCYSQDTVFTSNVDTVYMTESQFVDSTFGGLDSTRMSTRYLLNRVGLAFKPNLYNGITDSTDTIKDKWEFYKIYAPVYAAQVSNHPNFTDPLVFAQNADSNSPFAKNIYAHLFGNVIKFT
jgi:hypothetical protein